MPATSEGSSLTDPIGGRDDHGGEGGGGVTGDDGDLTEQGDLPDDLWNAVNENIRTRRTVTLDFKNFSDALRNELKGQRSSVHCLRMGLSFANYANSVMDLIDALYMQLQAAAADVFTEIEVDLGPTPISGGVFIVTAPTVSATTEVAIYQAPGPYTGKGTLADESQMDSIIALASPGSGIFTVTWQTQGYVAPGGSWIGKVRGNFKFRYTASG